MGTIQQNHGKPIKVPTKTFLGTGKIEDLYGEPVSYIAKLVELNGFTTGFMLVITYYHKITIVRRDYKATTTTRCGTLWL